MAQQGGMYRGNQEAKGTRPTKADKIAKHLAKVKKRDEARKKQEAVANA